MCRCGHSRSEHNTKNEHCTHPNCRCTEYVEKSDDDDDTSSFLSTAMQAATPIFTSDPQIDIPDTPSTPDPSPDFGGFGGGESGGGGASGDF